MVVFSVIAFFAIVYAIKGLFWLIDALDSIIDKINAATTTRKEYKIALERGSSMVENYQELKVKDLPTITVAQFKSICAINASSWELRKFHVLKKDEIHIYPKQYVCAFRFTNYREWRKYDRLLKEIKKYKAIEEERNIEAKKLERTEKYLRIVQADIEKALNQSQIELNQCEQELKDICSRMEKNS